MCRKPASFGVEGSCCGGCPTEEPGLIWLAITLSPPGQAPCVFSLPPVFAEGGSGGCFKQKTCSRDHQPPLPIKAHP